MKSATAAKKPARSAKPTSKKRGKPSLAAQAYERLAQRLLDHRFVPGMLLNRRELAKELKMSVAPVLEALVQLESDGFLESIPRKGTLVRSVRIEDLRGQLVLREALECEAARYYCGKPIERNASKLLELARKIDGLDGIHRGDEWQAEYEFHLALIRCAGFQALENAYQKVMQQKLFMALNLYMSAHTSLTRDSHVRLVKELRTSNADKAERVIRTHLRNDKAELYARPDVR